MKHRYTEGQKVYALKQAELGEKVTEVCRKMGVTEATFYTWRKKHKRNAHKPEAFVRKMVHRMGYRFRLHRQDLPGKPDLVFPGLGKNVLVHGCF